MGHRGLLRYLSNGYGIQLGRQGSGVQIPPPDSFSWRIFEKEEEEAEKQKALANLITRRERRKRMIVLAI